MPNMVQQFVNISVGEVMLVAHTAKPPDQREWDAYVAALVKRDVEKLRSLVFTDGGAPNTAQRSQLNKALEGKTSTGAVVSPSTMVRGVVTALSWFNPKIRAFAPNEVNDAFAYLDIRDPKDTALIRTGMDELRHKLGDDSFKSIARPAAPAPRV
jgi:hypothetical protein